MRRSVAQCVTWHARTHTHTQLQIQIQICTRCMSLNHDILARYSWGFATGRAPGSSHLLDSSCPKSTVRTCVRAWCLSSGAEGGTTEDDSCIRCPEERCRRRRCCLSEGKGGRVQHTHTNDDASGRSLLIARPFFSFSLSVSLLALGRESEFLFAPSFTGPSRTRVRTRDEKEEEEEGQEEAAAAAAGRGSQTNKKGKKGRKKGTGTQVSAKQPTSPSPFLLSRTEETLHATAHFGSTVSPYIYPPRVYIQTRLVRCKTQVQDVTMVAELGNFFHCICNSIVLRIVCVCMYVCTVPYKVPEKTNFEGAPPPLFKHKTPTPPQALLQKLDITAHCGTVDVLVLLDRVCRGERQNGRRGTPLSLL